MRKKGSNPNSGMNYGILFVGLNMVDSYLTKTAISLGGEELNPIMTHIGGIIPLKGLIALGIVTLFYHFGKEKLLKPLCIGMILISAYNIITILSWGGF